MKAEGMLPKEHGAYGQIAFPLVTVFLVAGLSRAGVLLGFAAIAGFLAHEPAAILLGHRGPRARRERSSAALRWLLVCVVAGGAAAAVAAMVMAPDVRWSLAVPGVPALLLTGALVAGRGKSWYGETAAACGFAGMAVPVALAAGTTVDTALTVAIPFAVLFTTTTLAVRVVILRVRGGGDPQAVTWTRRATFAVATVAGLLIVLLIMNDWLEPVVLAASAPGLAVASVLAARPPGPARLRVVGWSLVAVSALTAVIVIAMA